MNLLTQNSKIKKTSKHFNKRVFNFSIPAYKTKKGKITCPFADTCIKFCYAQKGFYKLSAKWSELKYKATKQDNFISLMNQDIQDKKPDFIRVHDSGDYYSKEYLKKWLQIAKDNPSIKFYSYTNSIKMVKDAEKEIPSNFDFIFSDSGKQKNMINQKKDRHTKIFKSLKDLKKEGYQDSSNYDLYATKWFNTSKKVGLIFH
tara:strand:- start:395 stop:1000 length:606 start_codon:yes stop_codon:yes gene_type:complete